jgi:hypothetical protein
MPTLLKRWWFWALVLIFLLPVSSWLAMVATRTKITVENAEKIGPGMTLVEIEQILGGPPRCEACFSGKPTSLDTANPAYSRAGATIGGEIVLRWWESREAFVWVSFETIRSSYAAFFHQTDNRFGSRFETGSATGRGERKLSE